MPVTKAEQLGVIGPVRCPCGQVIAWAANRFHELRKQGKSQKEALDQCGIPTQSPLIEGAPASECCRAYIMCSVDLTSSHLMYREVSQYAELKRAPFPTKEAKQEQKE